MARLLRWGLAWRVLGEVAWLLLNWGLRAHQTRRRRRGMMGRVVAWDRSVSKRMAMALPVPRGVVVLGAFLGDVWLWTFVCGALLWRWTGKWWWRWAIGVTNSVLTTLFGKRHLRRRRPLMLRRFYGK